MAMRGAKPAGAGIGLGLLKGLGVTFTHDDASRPVTCSTRTSKETCRPRTRGVIALKEENCTVCMLCARAVPRLVHLHRGPQGAAPAAPRGRPAAQRQHPRPLRHRLRAVHVLRHLRRGLPVRRAVLEPRVRVLRAEHRRPAARQGPARRVDGRPCPSPSRSRMGAEVKGKKYRDRAERRLRGSSRSAMALGAIGVVTHAERRARRALPRGRARRRSAAQFILLGRRVRRLGAGARLHRRRHRPVPVRHHAHAGADAAARTARQRPALAGGRRRRCSWSAILGGAARRRVPRRQEINARHAPIARHGRRSPTSIFTTLPRPVRGRRRAPARPR